MKKLLLIIFVFASYFSYSQDTTAVSVDSTQIPVTVTLKAKYHAYIISFLSDRGAPQKINYFNQFRSQIDTGYNPDQVISATVPSSLVVEIYNVLGSQQERYTTTYNNEIKTLLIPQIYSYRWLINTIQQIGLQNAMVTERKIIDDGVKFIMQIEK
jgi:hypothetical protein